MNTFLRTKSIDALIEAAEHGDKRLNKTLGPWSLTFLGVGIVIGSGIWTLTGTAAAGEVKSYSSILNAPVLDLLTHGPNAISSLGRPGAGPAVAVSFILAALACCFAALCYAELASMIPIAGSAYTYTYATLGELLAWIIGWDLVLEYAVANMSVAVGFSAYFNNILDSLFGVHLPKQWSEPMMAAGAYTGSYFNVPALLIMLALSYLLVRGVKEGAGANNVMVGIKLIAILIFVFGAAGAINPVNYHPFAPNGASGVLTGAAIVFFTYIGFDAVSTAAEECENPQRDLPIGLVATLVTCTLLYASVAVVLTGIQNWKTLGNDAPVVTALQNLKMDSLRRWVGIGALTGMISSLLVGQYGQARIWFAMSRDKLLPSWFSRVHPKFKTPHVSTWVAGFFVGIPAGFFDIGTFADLSSIGTLFAFVLVSAGVIVLRKKQPERRRTFRVPWVPFIPCVSIGMCMVLMLSLTLETWIRFFVWLIIGLVIYATFGRKNSAERTAQ